MASKPSSKGDSNREKRLAAALRENLGKRKAQLRAREEKAEGREE